MLNTDYMEFFNAENISETEDILFLKSFFVPDEEILFSFSGLHDRLAYFTTKRIVFMYVPQTENPDKISSELDFVHYDKISSYSVISSKEYANAKLEVNLPDIGVIGFNFSNFDSLLKLFAFLSKVI